MTKLNKYLTIGLGIYGLTLFLVHVIGLPHFVHGFGLGIAIAFEIIGAYSLHHDFSKVRDAKKNFLRKCWSK